MANTAKAVSPKIPIFYIFLVKYTLKTINGAYMNPTLRSNVKIGQKVKVVQKQDQRSGKLTEGVVSRLLTNSQKHPRGIKVMLESGIVGRVKEIL